MRGSKAGGKMTRPLCFMAASVPRYLRTARLPYLPLDAVLGSWTVEGGGDIGVTFDVIMLPEADFQRAKTRLGVSQLESPALRRASLTGGFVPQDVRIVEIAASMPHPARRAALRLISKFRLTWVNPIYADERMAAAMAATRAIKRAS